MPQPSSPATHRVNRLVWFAVALSPTLACTSTQGINRSDRRYVRTPPRARRSCGLIPLQRLNIRRYSAAKGKHPLPSARTAASLGTGARHHAFLLPSVRHYTLPGKAQGFLDTNPTNISDI